MEKQYKKPSLLIIVTLLGLAMLQCGKPKSTQAPETLWAKTYGGADVDEGYSVQQTTDGGYIVAGWTSLLGAGSYDIYLIKTDANGNDLWTKTYGGPSKDVGNSVQETTDGGYIIAGWTYSFGAGENDVYLIKTDVNGKELWTKIYGGASEDVGCSVQETTDGGYIIAGYTSSFGAGGYDVYLIKTDANGDTLWTKTYGGASEDVGHSVQETTDGGYIIAGYTHSFGTGGYDIYFIKTDVDGNELWTKTYGGVSEDVGCSVQETTDGGYIIAGYTSSFGVGGYDIYLIKTEANGKELWTKIYGGTSEDVGRSAQETTDGGYIIAGWTSSFGAGGYDIYLIKTDASGDTLWTKTYGGTSEDVSYSVQETTDGGYIIVGYTSSLGAGSYDVYLIKTDVTSDIEE